MATTSQLGGAENNVAVPHAPRVLIADDQPHILDALELLLEPEAFHVEKARSRMMVIEALQSGSFDALLVDLNYTRDTTSGKEGLDLLTQIKTLDSHVPVIVMTPWAHVEVAVEAMRRGARDFIPKPWDNARLLTILRTQIDLHHAVKRAYRLEAENRMLRGQNLPDLIATAPSMQSVLSTITRIGPSDANVLITGEHGTGKEVVAQMLHGLSQRASRSLVAVNTGALPEGTFESELFGHVKGAFTDARVERIGRFELADGGTLFLDEIANVPLRQQAKLLRVLETGEMERVGSSKTRKVDVRLLSATNADLHKESEEGRFRQDLLFRLNTVEIHLPPLRERREDVPALSAHFLSKYTSKYNKQITGFSPEGMGKLLEYAWPGNVRELDHTVERAVIMCREEQIQPWHMGLQSTGRSRSTGLDALRLEEAEAL